MVPGWFFIVVGSDAACDCGKAGRAPAGPCLRWRLGATRSQSVNHEPFNSEHWISIIWNAGTDTTRLLGVGLVALSVPVNGFQCPCVFETTCPPAA